MWTQDSYRHMPFLYSNELISGLVSKETQYLVTHQYISEQVSDVVQRPFLGSGQQGPCIPYKLCNHDLSIGNIIFLLIENTHSTGHN